jgi:hypothetical protein
VLTVYVPAPPVPVPRATITVPAVTPAPEIVWPTANVPVTDPPIVRIVPEILEADEVPAEIVLKDGLMV